MSRKTIHDPRYQALIQKLRSARRQLRLRQSDVAKALGTARTWVCKVESCDLRVDILQLVSLCKLYRLRLRDLLRDIEEERPE